MADAADLESCRAQTQFVQNIQDQQFAEKVADIVGFYIDPPDNAVVLSLNENTQIQALDRTQPGLPVSENRIASRTHDYKRHGTTALIAAFNVLTVEVAGRLAKRSRSRENFQFLKQVVRGVLRGLEVHIILDNLSAHETEQVKQLLGENSRVHFHFTSTSSTWLNAVEGWFA